MLPPVIGKKTTPEDMMSVQLGLFGAAKKYPLTRVNRPMMALYYETRSYHSWALSKREKWPVYACWVIGPKGE